ncbi:MAG: bifunctional 5,10-methylene-tetrahydrofolate dehydrogenase/5,10-methylene-tetrahydrofolate cyclohydrolase [Odoribacteraceae bacterium]|jgi:methylenetetrahydrofolate dehydrogenase (NADP+)/methenyltetrahydrofolate cyclohydrolase|nr:bifunctional 5,10-methylene-tetrahydrofolate dehydrogenase/5,10-methylene-tetrahydrofolate cyclohydrolase [Odoribacteraceae bacterium]
MERIDGKEIAARIKEELAAEISRRAAKGEKTPHLAAVLVGNDAASETYVAAKVKACQAIGMKSTELRFPAEITEEQLLEVIDRLNRDDDVDGYIVQLPLPRHLPAEKILGRIDPAKDVDGFHPVNAGRMLLGLPAHLPATPAGIVEMLSRHGVETERKHCVIVGRSNIVGTPLSVLMSRKSAHANCTVTLCHSGTPNIKTFTLQADILVVAIGVPRFITADMVKEGAVVVDVGIHRVPSPTSRNGFRLVGDVDFENVAPRCSAITPVPGGVGPMTIVSLLRNTLQAATR